MFEEVLKSLGDLSTNEKELAELKKLLPVFFLGQIIGLPTLKSILLQLGKTSNYSQVKYNKICKNLSNKEIDSIFTLYFEQVLYKEFKKRCSKHKSNFSREIVTAVLDDSVFKQWLTSKSGVASFEKCYAYFFSGQYHKAVYGCKMVCLGISIDGVLYPLYFSYCQKKEKATKVAIRLLAKWKVFWKRLYHKEGLLIPYISLSCDSGYNNKELENSCVSARFHYISVPQKGHLIYIKGQKYKIKSYINEVVLAAEKKWQEEKPEKPFVYRIRAYYSSKKAEIVLLFFRLNKSKKISVIYSTNLDFHAKTLRRQWFQRTYIEQFFRTLKHVLKIQQAITQNKRQFSLKLLRFSFNALEAQLLIRFIRKRNPKFREKRFGFQVLQRYLAQDEDILAIISSYI